MRNAELHLFAGLGSVLMTAAIVVPTVFLGNSSASTDAPLKDYEVIEASLAYKAPSTKPKPKQPQKEMNQPVPEAKPEGVSRDENKPVDEKKDEKKPDAPKKDEKIDPLAKYRREQDPDNQSGAVTQPSASEGSETGVGDITKGHPYLGQLMADLDWTIPNLARTGDQPTVGCIKLNADGTVARTWFEARGGDDVATLADKALRDLKDKRAASPTPVPDDGTPILKRLTSKGICINLTAK